MSKQTKHELSRRAFLAATAGTVLAQTDAAHAGANEQSTAPSMPFPALHPDKGSDTFSFPLLGDLHYDKLEHHDMDWLKREKPNDVHQVENYSRISAEVTPALFQSVKALASKSGANIAFVLHIGDLVEGLCGSGQRSETQNNEALAFVREHDFKAPFLFVKGNHDITGLGSPEAFKRIFLPFLAQQTRQEKLQANYSLPHGNAQFVFFDAYDKSSLDWLETTLKARTAPHLFVVIHPPVVPYDARSLWHIYAKAQEQPQRTRLLNLLGKHRVLVLCGHLHKYGTVVCKTESGPFLQVATISVIPSLQTRPTQELSGIANYGPELVKMEPNFEPKSEADRRQALPAEAPHIVHFEYADAPGHGMVNVNKGNVTLDLYAGVERKVWRSLNLTELLAKA